MRLETCSQLVRKEAMLAEIAQLMTLVDRDLGDSGKDLSADNRFEMAYRAALQLCTIALRAEGYAVKSGTKGHHNVVLSTLVLTLGESQRQTYLFLSTCSSQRSHIVYDAAGTVMDRDADELRSAAEKLRADVVAWLHERHPKLLPPGLARPA